ncbi:MAG: helix-turn-helix domain-containing protein [Candidatus Omnitrophota bacterium]|jgi:two-component system nitrogen regulation response regulator GlnG
MKNRAEDLSKSDALSSELDGLFLNVKMDDVYKIVVEAVEKPLIERALARTFGNQVKAAKILGISRNTVRTKIHKFGIDVSKWKL